MRSPNRRGFLGLLGALVATPLVSASLPRKTFGYLTPEIVVARGYDNTKVRVFFDGVDCQTVRDQLGPVMACDDRHGWIEVFARDRWGHYYGGRDHKLVRARIYGQVRVTLP
jgi:hypothetical protein